MALNIELNNLIPARAVMTLTVADKFYQLWTENNLKFDINGLQGGLFNHFIVDYVLSIKRASLIVLKSTHISPATQELTMEINSTQNTVPSQITPVKSLPAEDTRLAEQNSLTATSQDANSDDINLSAESLKLAKTSTIPNTSAQAPISSSEQAQQLVGQLLSNIVNNPAQGQAAFGSMSQNRVSGLLA